MKKWQKLIGITAIVAMLFSGLGAAPVLAAPLQVGGAAKITLTGQVTTVDTTAGTLQVAVLLRIGPVTYTVKAPSGFDLGTIAVSDTVKVKGTLTAPNAVSASSLARIAGPEPVEIDLTGTVTTIDVALRTLQVQVAMDSGPVGYEVQVPDGFDLSTVQVGDTVHVVGGLVAGQVLRADSVEVLGQPTPTYTPTATLTPTVTLTPSITPTPTVTRTPSVTPTITATPVVTQTPTVSSTAVFDKQGFYCRNLDARHPVGSRIAERYGVPYEQVMTWFCQDRMGFGQIMLALQTAKVTEEAPEDLVQERVKGKEWGDIWSNRGLIGKNKKGTSTGDETELDAESQDAGTGKAGGPKDKTKVKTPQSKSKGKALPNKTGDTKDKGGKGNGNGRP